MLGKLASNLSVVRGFIGHQARLAVKVLAHKRSQGVGLEIVHDHTADLASIAVNQRQYLVFVGVATPLLLAFRLHGLVVADESFVHLNRTAATAERSEIAITHCLSDAMPHEPSSLEGNAQGAVQLVGADPLLAGRDKEDRLQPDMQLDVARLEDGPNLDGERLAAGIALVGAYAGALALQLAAAINGPTVRAYATVGPNAGLDKLVCSFFVMEVWSGEYGHGSIPFAYPEYRVCEWVRQV